MIAVRKDGAGIAPTACVSCGKPWMSETSVGGHSLYVCFNCLPEKVREKAVQGMRMFISTLMAFQALTKRG